MIPEKTDFVSWYQWTGLLITGQPGWVYLVVGILVWYPLAGMVLRRLMGPCDIEPLVFFWILSPLAFATVVTILSWWSIAWAVSGGIMPSPWSEWARKNIWN